MAETLAGVRTTQDIVAKPVVAKPRRKTKLPVLSEKQRSERKQQIRVRLEEINNERVKHNADLARMTPERARLLSNLTSEKARQQGKIDSLMEEHFASATPGKLVDRILQSEMIEPRLQQLRGNVDKLDHSISWHRSKLQALGSEEGSLNREHDDLVADDLAEETFDAYIKWKDSWLVAEDYFDKLKQATLKARSLDKNFIQRLPRFGKQDPTFSLVVDSKLKDELVDETGQAMLVDELSKLYHLGDSNWAYQDPNISVSRRLKPSEPLRRETFDVGRKIGRTA